MSRYEDRLKDYVEVKDRIRLFYDKYPDGRLTTFEVRLTSEPDDKPRVHVWARAYRTPDDKYPGDGWSWMELPGTTPYTKGSELENVETSAWGRAIGALGIGIEKSIASQDEVDGKAGEGERVSASRGPEIDQETGGLIGIAGASGKDDFQLRQEAKRGWALPFRLTSGRKSFKVVAFGIVAEALATAKADVLNKRVTVWGTFQPKSFPKKQPDGTTKTIEYQVLELERIATPDWILPAEEALDAEPADDVDDEPIGTADDYPIPVEAR